jgi:hypothetical protein
MRSQDGIRMMSTFQERRDYGPTRREFLRAALGAAATAATGELAMAKDLIRKPIPRTSEMLPAIGLGTWQTFDVGASLSARQPLMEVLRDFAHLGGSVIDSSPMYGSPGAAFERDPDRNFAVFHTCLNRKTCQVRSKLIEAEASSCYRLMFNETPTAKHPCQFVHSMV